MEVIIHSRNRLTSACFLRLCVPCIFVVSVLANVGNSFKTRQSYFNVLYRRHWNTIHESKQVLFVNDSGQSGWIAYDVTLEKRLFD
jgi:hypothetical protein